MLILNNKSKVLLILKVILFSASLKAVSKSALINQINTEYKTRFEEAKNTQGKIVKINLFDQYYAEPNEVQKLKQRTGVSFLSLVPWNKVIANVQNFVKTEAKDNKDLQDILSKVIEYNSKVISNIKETYDDLESRALSEQATKLSTELFELYKKIKELKVKTGKIFSSGQEQAKDVLQLLLQKLMDLIKKRDTDNKSKMEKVVSQKKSYAELEKILNNSFEEQFGKRNIFSQQTKLSNWNGWKKAVATVSDNLKESFKSNKTLTKFLLEATDLNEKIFNNYKLIYNFAYGNKVNKNMVDKQFNENKKIKESLIDLSHRVKNYKIPQKTTNTAVEASNKPLLLLFIDKLIDLVNKMNEDFNA